MVASGFNRPGTADLSPKVIFMVASGFNRLVVADLSPEAIFMVACNFGGGVWLPGT